MSIRNIERLFNVIDNSLFTINGKLSYDRITKAFILLANEISQTETDESVWTIGEFGYASLDSLIIGAYWHYSECHAGQASKGYEALSALGRVFNPGMSWIEEDCSEYDVYSHLNDMAGLGDE